MIKVDDLPSGTKKDGPESSLWSLAFEGRTALDLKTPRTYRAKLEALRQALEDAWNATPAEKCAPLAKQLQDVLLSLEGLPEAKGVSELDAYRERVNSPGKSAVRRDRTTGS